MSVDRPGYRGADPGGAAPGGILCAASMMVLIDVFVISAITRPGALLR